MLPKPILAIVGSGIAIALGNTVLGPVVALALVAIIAYLALTSQSLTQPVTPSGNPLPPTVVSSN